MATRRSILGGNLLRVAEAIAAAVTRLDDIERSQRQLAVENTRADITQDQQDQLIEIQRNAEARLKTQAEFDQVNNVIGQVGEMTGTQAVAMFGDSAVSEALLRAFPDPTDLEGFTLNEANADQLRLDYLNEDIRIGQLPGATPDQIRLMEVAQNIFRGIGAADNAQVLLASTDAHTRLEISVQEGANILRRAQEDPNFLIDGQFLEEPYTSMMFGITTNDPEQALELIRLEQANLAATGATGAARISANAQLRDIYIRQAEKNGVDLDAIEVESIISAVQTGNIGDHANLGSFLAARIKARPEAADFYRQILAGAYVSSTQGLMDFQKIQEDFPGEENEDLREFLTQQAARLAGPNRQVFIESDGGFFGGRGFEALVTAGLPVDFSDPAQMAQFVDQAAEDVRAGRRSIEEIKRVNLEAGLALDSRVLEGSLSETVPADISTFIRRFQSGDGQERVATQTLQNLGMTRTEAGRARTFLNQIRSGEADLEAGVGEAPVVIERRLAAAQESLQALLNEVHARGR